MIDIKNNLLSQSKQNPDFTTRKKKATIRPSAAPSFSSSSPHLVHAQDRPVLLGERQKAFPRHDIVSPFRPDALPSSPGQLSGLVQKPPRGFLKKQTYQ